MSTLRVDQITDEEGTGAPDFPNGITVAGGTLSQVFNATVSPSDWTGSNPSIATIPVVGLLSADVPIVDLDLSSAAVGDILDIQADWSSVYRVEASDDDELKLYALEEPSETFNLTIKVVR